MINSTGFIAAGVEDKIVQVTAKIDAITGVYDDLHEKMHEIDKTRKNNLLFYGIKVRRTSQPHDE